MKHVKPEEVTQIVSALKESQKNDTEKGRIIDWLFKSLIGVIVWIGIGLRNDVDVLKNDVQKISTERVYSEKDMDAFRAFIQKPRFTRDDFDNLITPLVNSLNKNTIELNSRTNFMADTEKRLLKIEYKLEELILTK